MIYFKAVPNSAPLHHPPTSDVDMGVSFTRHGVGCLLGAIFRRVTPVKGLRLEKKPPSTLVTNLHHHGREKKRDIGADDENEKDDDDCLR